MKRNPKSARVLQRILNARQFCLKLIANVTYGYTAAGFSGRMPMAELADSIVQARHLPFALTYTICKEGHLLRLRVHCSTNREACRADSCCVIRP
jgi:DNA polymerase zeta